MSLLNPGAAQQAKRDAGAKVIRSAERRSPLRWLLAQRLRTQFLVVIATLFVAYAGASAILSATGLRAPPQQAVAAKKKPAPICIEPGMSVSERATCIADHDPPAVIRRVGTEKRSSAERTSQARASEEDRFRLQQELARVRDAKRHQTLREEFERRMAELIGGDLRLPPSYEGRNAYYEDTVVVMAEMLQLSDHPMKHSRGQKLSGIFSADYRSGATPVGGEEAERRLAAICGNIRSNKERSRVCAVALRDLVFQLRYSASKSMLENLVFSVRPSG